LALAWLAGCDQEQPKPSGPPASGQGADGQPADLEPARRVTPGRHGVLPPKGMYDAHTAEALAASVQQAVRAKDFLGLMNLLESRARRELTRNAKDGFLAALRIAPDSEQALLRQLDLETRSQLDLMSNEYFAAYKMYRGERDTELLRQLSGRLVEVRKDGDVVAARFSRVAASGRQQTADFRLKRMDVGWRLIVPAIPPAASQPASGPATRPSSLPVTEDPGQEFP
jgi:hypothetical protein